MNEIIRECLKPKTIDDSDLELTRRSLCDVYAFDQDGAVAYPVVLQIFPL